MRRLKRALFHNVNLNRRQNYVDQDISQETNDLGKILGGYHEDKALLKQKQN